MISHNEESVDPIRIFKTCNYGLDVKRNIMINSDSEYDSFMRLVSVFQKSKISNFAMRVSRDFRDTALHILRDSLLPKQSVRVVLEDFDKTVSIKVRRAYAKTE